MTENETPTPPSSQEQSKAGRAVKATGNYYKVVKGDNLLKIAGRKEIYGDPYKWTKIHQANPYVVDPDWIYTGSQAFPSFLCV